MLRRLTPAPRRHRHRGMLRRSALLEDDEDDDEVFEDASPSDSDVAVMELSPGAARRNGGEQRGSGAPPRRRQRCSFLDDAAGVDGADSDEEDGEEGSDCGGFVANTQTQAARTPQTDERAMYMRSLATPESEGGTGAGLVARMLGRRRGR